MNTKKYGLIGFPLGHSFSKKYFSEKFEKEGILDAIYELFPIENIEKFHEIRHKNPDLVGLNVTIPYKQSIFDFLDEIDITAKTIGAVNTIKFLNKKLIGYNTDVIGFENALKIFLKGAKVQKALVFGTGGASKAVIYVLKKMNIDYQLVSRTRSSEILNYKAVHQLDFANYQLLINTTPLGTFPNIDNCIDIPYSKLTENHFLFDLVYNPKETLFMKKGKMHGAKVINGLDMLIGQAEAAWEIWNDGKE